MARRHGSTVAFLSALFLAVALNVSCGSGGSSSSSTPTTPTPTPTPTPNPGNPGQPVPNVNGNWVGTIQSPSFSTKVVGARFVQASPDCVDGSWNTNPPDARWLGAISVFAYPGILDGYMSFEIPGNGSKVCSGVGILKGDASDTSANLTWNISSFDADSCTGTTVPNVITMQLHR